MIRLRVRIIGIDAVHISTHAAVSGMLTGREVEIKKDFLLLSGMLTEGSFSESAKRPTPAGCWARTGREVSRSQK